MAHIANCIAEQEPASITKPPSPIQQLEPMASDEKPFTFRMQHPEQPRKYQLFPREKPLPALNSGKLLDSGNMASGKTITSEKTEKSNTSTGLKIRISAQNLIRRRKISVPELGPMTTVQEVQMDSPTIPGRPPLHERSISAPGRSGRNRPDDLMNMSYLEDDDLDAAIDDAIDSSNDVIYTQQARLLTRLVIPESKALHLNSMRSCGQLREGSTPLELKAARHEFSPKTRTPFTPASSTTDLTTPRSAATTTASATTIATPVSATPIDTSRASPKPWERRCITPSGTERSTTPQLDDPIRSASALGHRRGTSESSTIMDRGRPRKRNDLRLQNNASMSDLKAAAARSSDRKAFEELPMGWKPSEAVDHLDAADMETLLKQAVGQAERFEVLRPEDVESLSKELRRLDERTEYLRRTYNSLRAGRRNLHSRICQYLRSPRVARFSHDSMLKQEEALAELDTSIDDWVRKLETAENRRTRVRQKLLEHVAAATLLPASSAAVHASGNLQQVMGVAGPGTKDVSTPPRSPSKHKFASRNGSSSPSPQRVVAQVPSTILEHPVGEEVAEKGSPSQKPKSLRRGDTESIRIYAGDDVYALLADVENEISKMSSGMDIYTPGLPDSKRTELHRKQSHEMLNGGALCTDSPVKRDLSSAIPSSPPAPTPPMKDSPDMMLSSAVFRP